MSVAFCAFLPAVRARAFCFLSKKAIPQHPRHPTVHLIFTEPGGRGGNLLQHRKGILCDADGLVQLCHPQASPTYGQHQRGLETSPAYDEQQQQQQEQEQEQEEEDEDEDEEEKEEEEEEQEPGEGEGATNWPCCEGVIWFQLLKSINSFTGKF